MTSSALWLRSADRGDLWTHLSQQRWNQTGESFMDVCSRIDLSLRSEFINDCWQVFRQSFRSLSRIDAEFGGQSFDLIRSQDLLKLLTGDWWIWSRADPARSEERRVGK